MVLSLGFVLGLHAFDGYCSFGHVECQKINPIWMNELLLESYPMV